MVVRFQLGSRTAGESAVPQAAGGRNRFAQQLFTPLPGRYDRLAEVLSFGQNGRWRRTMIDHVVRDAPVRVLDVATGTAGVALELASRTTAEVIGVDLTPAMLEVGRRRIVALGARNRIQLVAGQGEQLPFPDAAFDALTFTYLLRYVDDPQATLRELARVVKPGGTVASLDFMVPPRRFWHAWWWLYTRLVLPAAGLVTGGRAWFRVGRFLGPNITAYYRRFPLAWMIAAWQAAGFGDIQVRLMSLGGGLVMSGTRQHD
jgi:demethylmenaquinone methyltransferase/2-methoxy-6-polyprenyl-1,4-benzoquinol methylase